MLIIYSAEKEAVEKRLWGACVSKRNKRIVTVLTFFFTTCGGVCKSGAGFFSSSFHVFVSLRVCFSSSLQERDDG